jgi:hypothetical protein
VLKNFPKFSLEQNFIIYMITGVIVFGFLQHWILKLIGYFKPFLFVSFLIIYLMKFQFPAMKEIMKVHPIKWFENTPNLTSPKDIQSFSFRSNLYSIVLPVDCLYYSCCTCNEFHSRIQWR